MISNIVKFVIEKHLETPVEYDEHNENKEKIEGDKFIAS